MDFPLECEVPVGICMGNSLAKALRFPLTHIVAYWSVTQGSRSAILMRDSSHTPGSY